MGRKEPDYIYAESMAQELLEQFKIEEPPVPVERIATGLGFEVLVAKFNDPGIAGYIKLSPKQIIVSKVDAATRRAFTIAHELGHYKLHADLESNRDLAILFRKPIGGEIDPKEKEANRFAANLLVPDVLLSYYHSYDISESQLAAIFGVSSEVMHYSLKNRGYR